MVRVDNLLPLPDRRAQFAWSHHVTVPEQSGCYALVSYAGEVLYVGLATDSIRGRMRSHLDTPEKRKASPAGAPFWFYYVLRSAAEVGPIERGWMNQAIMDDGAIPLLNKVYSPL
jgi:hypothetical protein